MLSKKNRLDKKTVKKIFKESKFVGSPDLILKFVVIGGGKKQISFIVPKTVSKKAVIRNLLRRRGYIALKKYFNRFPAGFLGVFIFKKHQDNVLILENEIKNMLNKIN